MIDDDHQNTERIHLDLTKHSKQDEEEEEEDEMNQMRKANVSH